MVYDRITNIEQLQKTVVKLGIHIPISDDLSALTTPLQHGPYSFPNAMILHPMEGCDGEADGSPGPLTIRRYERFAAGGAGLIWVEATAVVPHGRANPRQLWLHEGTKKSFAALMGRMQNILHEQLGPHFQPVFVLQLTHSGRYSRPEGVPLPLIAQHDPYRDAMVAQATPDAGLHPRIPPTLPVVNTEYLDDLQQEYVNAARLAYDIGFDAVDIKACHGYLINELLGSRQREDTYGGPFENRTRFLLDIIDAIHHQLGSDKKITTRLGVYDAVPYPYGWGVNEKDYSQPNLTEPIRLISLLQSRDVQLINITIANPYYNPHYGRPFIKPVAGGYDQPEHPLLGVHRFIELTAHLQRKFPDIAMIGTGYSWLGETMPQVAAGVLQNKMATLIGSGRLAFAYPDFPKDIMQTGSLDPEKICIACSGCSQIMRDGGQTGCIIRDREVYGPIYKAGREKCVT